jgi:hypothetical protein
MFEVRARRSDGDIRPHRRCGSAIAFNNLQREFGLRRRQIEMPAQRHHAAMSFLLWIAGEQQGERPLVSCQINSDTRGRKLRHGDAQAG